MSIEVRLGPREERMREFDAGKTDVMFLSYTEERAARYQLLDQTWTLAQVVMMRPGLPRYPHGLDDLWGVRIAVDQNSINHQLLAALPESRRPALTVVATREDEIRAFERGEVDGAAGNHLTMRFLMGALAENAVEVPLISRPYHLAVLPGRENIVAPLRVALDRLKNNGEFDRLVEQYLSSPVRRTLARALRDRSSRSAAAFVLLLFVGGTHVESLAAPAGAGAHQGGRAHRAPLSRSRRQRERHDLPHRSVRPIHVRQSGRDPHPRLRRGRAAVDEVLRADAPGLGAAGDGLLREGREDARVHLSRVPGPQEGRPGDLGRPARAADHHRRPHRRLPGHGARHHRSRQRPVGAARRTRLRLGDPRHRAEPDHGARRAGTHRALQPRVRRAVRRVDVGGRGPSVLGGAVPPRRGSRRDSRRHSAAGGVDRAGQARSHLGRQERRAARDRVDGRWRCADRTGRPRT